MEAGLSQLAGITQTRTSCKYCQHGANYKTVGDLTAVSCSCGTASSASCNLWSPWLNNLGVNQGLNQGANQGIDQELKWGPNQKSKNH